MIRFLLLLIFTFQTAVVCSQELYIIKEPASTLPKNFLGIRAFIQTYKEVNQQRNLFGMQLMYGLLHSVTVSAQATVTNHHGENFPAGLVTHQHNGNETSFYTGEFTRGLEYPYSFAGLLFNAKWRFFSTDAEHSHFRMALFGEYAFNDTPHDEAEPNLMDDTGGAGGGLIFTALKNRFAASMTTGFILPRAAEGLSPDLAGGPHVPTRIHYGDAFTYSLSAGYLLLPLKYKNYNQTNVNLYIELVGKSYRAGEVFQYDTVNVAILTPILEAGNYIEAYPGLQFIIRSNFRLDLAAAFPLINKSYARSYPMFHVAVQRYFR